MRCGRKFQTGKIRANLCTVLTRKFMHHDARMTRGSLARDLTECSAQDSAEGILNWRQGDIKERPWTSRPRDRCARFTSRRDYGVGVVGHMGGASRSSKSSRVTASQFLRIFCPLQKPTTIARRDRPGAQPRRVERSVMVNASLRQALTNIIEQSLTEHLALCRACCVAFSSLVSARSPSRR